MRHGRRVCVFELHVPGSRSLKEKRKVVKSLVERIHQRFRVSIAETDHHDLHQRAEIAMAMVSRGERDAERRMDAIRELIDRELEAEITNWDLQWIEGQP